MPPRRGSRTAERQKTGVLKGYKDFNNNAYYQPFSAVYNDKGSIIVTNNMYQVKMSPDDEKK